MDGAGGFIPPDLGGFIPPDLSWMNGAAGSDAMDGAAGSDANEAMLDEWVEAKRSRDFKRANSIRNELRRRGVEPSDHRPDNRSRGYDRGYDREQRQPAAKSVAPGEEEEEMLDEWVEAKR